MEKSPPPILRLRRVIPEVTEDLEAIWCRRDFVMATQYFREQRAAIGKGSQILCFACNYTIQDGEMIGVACFKGYGSRMVCQPCADKLLASATEQPKEPMTSEERVKNNKAFLDDVEAVKEGSYVISASDVRKLTYLSHRLLSEDRMSADEMRDQGKTLLAITGLAEFVPDDEDPPDIIRWNHKKPDAFFEAVSKAGGTVSTSMKFGRVDAIVRTSDRWHRIRPGQRIKVQVDGSLKFPDSK